MAKSFNSTSGRASITAAGWLKKLLRRRKRLPGISHLDERMRRDIGLGDGAGSELRKIERLRRP